jgi:hypothetical protein
MKWIEVIDARIAAARAELVSLETQRAYHLELQAKREARASHDAADADAADDDLVAKSVDRMTEVGARVSDMLRVNPGGLSVAAIRAATLGMPAVLVHGMISMLIQSGDVRQEGTGSSAVLFPTREPGAE